MTVQTKPKVPATKHCPDALMAMEPLVCDVPRVAAILMHMASSDNMVMGDEVGWMGQQLADIGKQLVALYYKSYEDARTGAEGGKQ